MNDREKLDLVRKAIETAKSMSLPSLEGLNAYQTGKAEGHLEGVATLAATLDAIVAEVAKKALTPNSRVRITNGPWKGQTGILIGVEKTVLGDEAEVHLDGHDLPISVSPIHLEVI